MNDFAAPVPGAPAPLPRRRPFRLYREGSPAILLLGVVLFFSFAPEWREAHLREGWARTDAKVTAATVHDPGSRWTAFWSRRAAGASGAPADAVVEVRLAYEFRDGRGALRSGEGAIGAWPRAEAERIARAMREGGVKTIRYDPADPARSSPSFDRPLLPMLLTVAGMVFAFAGGLLFLAIAFAQKRRDDGVADWAR